MSIAALGEGEKTLVRIGHREVLVACVEGQFYAVSAVCPHAGQSLGPGRLQGGRIRCPAHGAAFDLRTGACTAGPAQSAIACFPVLLEAGKVWIDIDH